VLRQVAPERRTRDVADDRRDLPGQALVYRCLLGRRAQRDLDAAAAENVIPGGCEPGTGAWGAQPPDSRLRCLDRRRAADVAVPGQSQLQRAAAGRWDRWLFMADAEVETLPAGIAAEQALAAAIIYLPPLHLTWATFSPEGLREAPASGFAVRGG
jgi:hypothetical protein